MDHYAGIDIGRDLHAEDNGYILHRIEVLLREGKALRKKMIINANGVQKLKKELARRDMEADANESN